MGKSDKNVNKQQRRFSQEQYEFLKQCSKKGDEGIKEWNEWFRERRGDDIFLEGADLSNRYFKKISLNSNIIFPSHVYLEHAIIVGANLEGANLLGAHLERAILVDANLKGANLLGAYLEGAYLMGACLEDAVLSGSRLGNVDFTDANLKSADFRKAFVNGNTLIWDCKIDHNTDFHSVGLDSARIDPGTKQLLKYNIRRMNWEDWYKEHWFWRWPVRLFWLLSDYGASGKRVVGVFFLLAFLFAAVYMNWAYWAPPGIVSNLIVQPEVGEAVLHYFSRALIRPVYFSIVTMTTLGFGDMYANKGSIAGHVILAVQVILGYVLLGALITRFAVLFTAGGPAGKFAESGKGPD